MTEERFYELCKKHDLTYSYSDDNRAWIRGVQTMQRIVKESESFLPGVAARIWNKVVDEKIVSDETRKMFYWREEK